MGFETTLVNFSGAGKKTPVGLDEFNDYFNDWSRRPSSPWHKSRFV